MKNIKSNNSIQKPLVVCSPFSHLKCAALQMFQILFTIFFFNASIYAQDACGVKGGPNPSWAVCPYPEIPGNFYVKVYFHRLQKDDGTGGVTDAQVLESFQILNDYMNPFNIYFVWDCSIHDIENTLFYEFPNAQTCSIVQQNPHSDGIDIYIGDDNISNFGLANSIPGKWIVISGSDQFSNFGIITLSRSVVMVHEMGHCLGLFHTFHGTAEGGGQFLQCGQINGDPSACLECVDGSNSCQCGDYVEDTPSDPAYFGNQYVFLFGNCIINPNVPGSPFPPDCTNQPYTPDVTNIMSASRLPCQNSLTPGQGKRMRTFLANHPDLQNLLLPSPLEPVVATFNYSQQPGCVLQFESDFEGGSHTWDFGDGTMNDLPNPSHDFSATDVYTVTHIICQNGVSFEHSMDVMVDCTLGFSCPCPNGGLNLGVPGQTKFASDYLTANQTVSGCVAIAGLFIFDIPVNFNNATVQMQPFSEMEVRSPNILTFFDSDIFSCEKMWYGIDVQSNAALALFFNTTVSDAIYAVQARHNSTVNITGVTFNKNKFGLYSNAAFNINSSFAGNTFDCTSSLKFPYTGQYTQAGIWVSNGNMLHVGVEGQPANIFKNINNGIVARRNSLVVENTSFEKIYAHPSNANYSIIGYGIYSDAHSSTGPSPFTLVQEGFGMNGNPTFTNCTTGIYGKAISLDVSENKMLQMATGIRTEYCHQQIDLHDNNITCSGMGIEMSQSDPTSNRSIRYNNITLTGKGKGILVNEALIGLTEPVIGVVDNNIVTANLPSGGQAVGIELVSNLGTNLTNNTVNITNATSHFTGIKVDGSISGNIQCNHVYGNGAEQMKRNGITGSLSQQLVWQCNDVHNIYTGIRFDGTCISAQNFRGNYLDNHSIGLRLTPGAVIGAQTHRGNLWNGTFSSEGAARNEGIEFDVSQSIFTVQSNSLEFLPNPIITPNSSIAWFETSLNPPPGGAFECATELPNCPPPGLLEDNDKDEVDVEIAVGFETTPALKWTAERYLYRKLEKYGELTEDNSDLESFHLNNENSSVGKFHEIDAMSGELFEVPSAQSLALNNNYQSISEKTASLCFIDKQIPTTSGPALATLQAQRASLVQEITALTVSNEASLQNIRSLRQSAATSAALQNLQIGVSTVYEENEQTVNDIYLNTVAKGVFEFSNTQQETLKAIASQCPVKGGMAVFKARSLLNMTEDFTESDELCLEDLREREDSSEPGIKRSKDFMIFPNPGNGQVTLFLPKSIGSEENGEVRFFNLTGVEIMKKSLPKDIRSLQLDVSGFPEGIYICKVSFEGEGCLTKRLMIIR